jgi:hypothetical protein
LEAALDDIGGERAWIVDQADGIDRLTDRVARAGFAEVSCGTPG